MKGIEFCRASISMTSDQEVSINQLIGRAESTPIVRHRPKHILGKRHEGPGCD